MWNLSPWYFSTVTTGNNGHHWQAAIYKRVLQSDWLYGHLSQFRHYCLYHSVFIRSIPYWDVHIVDRRNFRLGFFSLFPLFFRDLFQSRGWEIAHILIEPNRPYCFDITCQRLIDIELILTVLILKCMKCKPEYIIRLVVADIDHSRLKLYTN